MNTYILKKANGTLDWASIEKISIDIPYLDTPDDISANAQICYNDEEFLVHLSTAEKNIRAAESGPVGVPCEDSCLEFFFCPMENDTRYFNIEFNMNACVYLGFGSNVINLVRLVPEETVEEMFAPKINKTADGWEIFYRVPYTLIRRFFPDFKVYSGKQMRANCYKCADLSEPPHYLSWNKIEGEPFTFHKSHCFGNMIFE